MRLQTMIKPVRENATGTIALEAKRLNISDFPFRPSDNGSPPGGGRRSCGRRAVATTGSPGLSGGGFGLFRGVIIMRVRLDIFPARPAELEVRERCVPQRRQVNMYEQEGTEGARQQPVHRNQDLEATDGQDKVTQWFHVHHEDTGNDHQGCQDEHDRHIRRLLQGVELVLRRLVVRIWLAPQKEVEEVVEGLGYQAFFDISNRRHVKLDQVFSHKCVVHKP